MAFDVTRFRSELGLDGARSNLFEVVIPNFNTNFGIDSASTSNKLTFMCKTAQLPGSTIGIVPIQYFGREVKVAGNRTFQDWTINIINDEDFLVRNSMEKWMNALNDPRLNIRNSNAVSTDQTTPGKSYAVDALVNQYGKSGNLIKTYNFRGMFPVDISAIDLDWGNNDSIEEFSVTFAYQYWESVSSGVSSTSANPLSGLPAGSGTGSPVSPQ